MKKNDPIIWNKKPGKLFSDVAGRRFAIVVMQSNMHDLWLVPVGEIRKDER